MKNKRSIAVGMPVFERTTALRMCLDSIDENTIDSVIIADNGHTHDRESIYSKNWGFKLKVINLEYDVGIGACRAAIANKMSEDYLIVVDNDMELPSRTGIQTLRKILESEPQLGGVSGILLEGSRIRSGCTNFHEEDLLGENTGLIQSLREDPSIHYSNDNPYAIFDKLTNAAMIRKECIDDYSWNQELPVKEHIDFYLGHYHCTDWEFAVCPTVFFQHNKGINEEYRENVRWGSENSREKSKKAASIIRDNWGYSRIAHGQKPEWIDTKREPLTESVYRSLGRNIPMKYLLPIRDISEKILSLKR